MLVSTGLFFDIEPLVRELGTVTWDHKDRCDINQPTGHWLYDPYEIKDKWEGSAFDDFLQKLSFPVGEVRLMKLGPGTSYRSHADIDDRYHLNLVTNDQSYLIDLENKKMHKINNDGVLYRMDAGRIHTACNFGSTDRIQLVIRIPLERNTGEEYFTKILKFKNLPFNFRYIFDNEISTFLNKLTKDKSLGFFNPKSDTELEIHIEKNAFDLLMSKLKKLQCEIEIYD